jgi:hypothetical protein
MDISRSPPAMPRPRYRQDPLPIGPAAPPVELFGPEQPNPPGGGAVLGHGVVPRGAGFGGRGPRGTYVEVLVPDRGRMGGPPQLEG